MIKPGGQAADSRVMASSSPLLGRFATGPDHDGSLVESAGGDAVAPTDVIWGDQSGRASRAGSRRVVGLEITDTMVRAVSVPPRGLGSGPVTHAEVELPLGTVRHGDVVDQAALIDALQELWKVGGFPTKRVVVGIGNSDVVTRQIDLPDLDDRDLRSALRYEIAGMIPFPVADSVLDLSRIGTVEDDRGVRRARVLSVAALRAPLQTIVAVTRAAGLRPVAIDLTPFALIRAVAPTAESDETEAIVHLGDFSIAVVVHRNGVPLFTRSLATSAAGAGISRELEDELQLIEQYIQRTTGADVVEASGSFDPVVSAIRGTLEYYAIQAGATPLTRITLTGNNEWAANIAPSVALLTELPVALSDPMNTDAPYQVSPFIAPIGTSSYVAALGLAQSPGGDVRGPAVLKLLPGRNATTTPRVAVVRSISSAVVAALLLIVFGAVVGPDTDTAQADAGAAESTLAENRSELTKVLPSLHDATELRGRSRRLEELDKSEIDWPRILGAVRDGFPADATLLSLTAEAATTTQAGSQPGSIQLSGQTTSQPSISALLVRLASIPGIVTPWLVSARAGGEGGPDAVTTFSITMDLDSGAVVPGISSDNGGSGT